MTDSYAWLQREHPEAAKIVGEAVGMVAADGATSGIAPEIIARAVRSLLSPPNRVEWGEPRIFIGPMNHKASIRAACGCWVGQDHRDADVEGLHCSSHTFADLVSGETLLRKKMKEAAR